MDWWVDEGPEWGSAELEEEWRAASQVRHPRPRVHSSGREETLFTPHRHDILDPALTRPGRFARLGRIELPDEVET